MDPDHTNVRDQMFIGWQSYSLCHGGLLKESFSLGFKRERFRFVH